MDSAAQRFVTTFADADFRHREPLLSGIRGGAISLESVSEDSSQEASAYSDIYEFRLEHLRRKQATQHVESMRSDVEALCEGLKADPSDPCDLWNFTEPPYFLYSVFVGRRSRRVLGCVKAVDDRLIDEQIRRELWGEANPEDEQ